MKKIFIAIITIFIIQVQAVFADFNAGIGLYIPLGASIAQSYQDYKLGVNNNDGKLQSSGAGFEWGVGITPGIYNGFDNYMGFSLSLDLAYHRDVYSYNESKAAGTTGQYQNVKTTYYFDTLNIGILPKFNIKGFSIGINVGAKFGINPNVSYDISGLSQKYSSDTKPRTYIRGTFDYSIFFRENMAINIGFYLGYDWGYNWKESLDALNVLKDEAFGNLDIGLQVGYRFGPKF